MLLQSRFRTRKKEEADLFFVPTYVKCVRMSGGLNDKEINQTYVKVSSQMPYFRLLVVATTYSSFQAPRIVQFVLRSDKGLKDEANQVKILEMLLQSRFRTKKKEEADLFFVPTYVKCVRMSGGLNDKEINKTYVKVKRMEMERKDFSHKVDKLIERHAWISSEKHLFGRGGTDYDFVSRDPSKARDRFEKLQLEQSSIFDVGVSEHDNDELSDSALMALRHLERKDRHRGNKYRCPRMGSAW